MSVRGLESKSAGERRLPSTQRRLTCQEKHSRRKMVTERPTGGVVEKKSKGEEETEADKEGKDD